MCGEHCKINRISCQSPGHRVSKAKSAAFSTEVFPYSTHSRTARQLATQLGQSLSSAQDHAGTEARRGRLRWAQRQAGWARPQPSGANQASLQGGC